MPCSAWPNSWNSVVTSSKLSSAGLPRRRLGEVRDVVDDGLRVEQSGLVDEAVHPRAATLVVALEEIGIEQRERAAVRVEHVEDANVGMVDGNVGALRET